jgi:hypothetical protein
MHWLLRAIEAHKSIPTTFDDRLPEQAFVEASLPALLIGNTYLVPNADGVEVPSILVEAIVLEREKKAWGIYKLTEGKQIICTSPLTDKEIDAYRRSPETFFGVLKPVGRKGFAGPLDAFDFLFESYSKTPHKKLLEFMASWPEIEELRWLDQQQLAEHYCDRLATTIWNEAAANRAKKVDVG